MNAAVIWFPYVVDMFQPVIHDWCNIGRGMCNPVCRMVPIKEPLLLIGKSSLVVAAGFLSRYLSGPFPHSTTTTEGNIEPLLKGNN